MDYEFFETAEKQVSEYGGDVLTPSDVSQDIFGPYANADFINVGKILNATNFFVFSPAPLQTYYWTIVKRNLEWYYGYVYGIHNHGILSFKLGSKICKMSAQLTISGGFRWEGDNRAENYLNHFCKTRHIEAKLKQKLPMLNAIGFMLAKLDVDLKGRKDISYVQGNRYFAQTDDERNVTAFFAVIKVLTAKKDMTGDEDAEGYYLVEERFYLNNAPVFRYRMYKGPVIATAPVFGAEVGTKGIEFEQLPPDIRRYIVRRFGDNILGKCFKLPFDNLGAVIVPNTYSATGMDDYTCFSDSTLADIHTNLYEYDLTQTQKNENKYICQDFVALPDTMIPPVPHVNGDAARAAANELNTLDGFNKRVVKRARAYDPTHSVPFIYSPSLKTDVFNNDINQILNETAAGAQFSPVTLAGFLHNGAERTATEVTADENATRLTITDKRTLIAEAHNRLMATLLRSVGYIDENGQALSCSMVFNPGSLSNPKLDLEILEKKQINGWVSHKNAVAQANPQLSPKEVEKELTQIEFENGGAAFYSGRRNIDSILVEE